MGPSTLAPFLSPIGSLDLEAERRELGPALEDAVLRVLRSGQYVLGPEVAAFEREFAAFQGVAEGVGVASGTDALVLCLKALDIGPGDEVVTTPFTFFASAGAIAWVGATPRFADIDPDTGLMLPAAIPAACGPRTKAVLAVHLYGQLCDPTALTRITQERGLALIEDGAQAHGATRDGKRCGQIGQVAAFSFYPTKNLGALGDAGAVLTQDPELAKRLRRLRDHGSSVKYVHDELGTNSRLAAMQAAALRIKLGHLEAWNQRRTQLAQAYGSVLAGHPSLRPMRIEADSQPCWHQYSVRCLGGVEQRDRIRAALSERGISTGVHYPTPVHLQTAARHLGYGPGDMPGAETLAEQVLCLPIFPQLPIDQARRIGELLTHLAS